jgi:hypothetical protein
MKIIHASNGAPILVDDDDYEDLIQFSWYITHNGYAARCVYENGRQTSERMHRRIMGLKSGDPREVDHRFGLKLDNRKSELRICTTAQNLCNVGIRKDNTSGYKGVKLRRKGRGDKMRGGKKWETRISHNGKNRYIGCFETPEEAYAAYCKVARELHGEFANLGAASDSQGGA